MSKKINNILKAATGGDKLEFPYNLPPIKIDFEPQARQTLLIVSSILAASLIISAFSIKPKK